MSVYNEDEMVAPEWLSKEFLLDVLRENEKNDEIEIESHEISPASMKGDHYASCIFRAKVVYRKSRASKETFTSSLIIKTMPEEDAKKNDMLKNYTLFESEISMYTKTLPEIQRILAKHGDNTIFGPRAVYSSLKPRKVIIFEDLCVKGFDCVRGRSLRMDEYEAVLIKLAKLHAVSYVIGQSEQARQVNKYQESVYTNKASLDFDMMYGGFKRFRRLLEAVEELRVYLPKFQEVEDEIFEGCLELYNAYKNGEVGDINVLNHGDFHARNLMYKQGGNGTTEDVMMVDFQLPMYGPSTIDLTFATFMLFDNETRLKKRDEMYRFYFEHFIATLKMLNFEGKLPQFGQFQISNLKYRKFAKFLIVTFMPMINMMFTASQEEIKDFDMDSLVGDGDALMVAYLKPAFIKEIKQFLPEYLNRGFLD